MTKSPNRFARSRRNNMSETQAMLGDEIASKMDPRSSRTGVRHVPVRYDEARALDEDTEIFDSNEDENSRPLTELIK